MQSRELIEEGRDGREYGAIFMSRWSSYQQCARDAEPDADGPVGLIRFEPYPTRAMGADSGPVVMMSMTLGLDGAGETIEFMGDAGAMLDVCRKLADAVDRALGSAPEFDLDDEDEERADHV